VDELVEATRRLQEAKLTLGIQSTECQEKVATVQSLAKRSRALEREIEVYEDGKYKAMPRCVVLTTTL
jgi:cell division protein FtsB